MRGEMAVYYQYVNEEDGLAKVVVGGQRVAEVYVKDNPQGSPRLVERGKVRELASRVRLI